MPSVILHISNEDPVLGEMEDVPGINDSIVVLRNPRRRDGKDLPHIDPNVTTVIWPLNRINYIEVLPSAEEEEIITHVRE